MRRFSIVAILVVLVAASAFAGYEVGANKTAWDAPSSRTTPAQSEQSASGDATFSVIFDRVAREAAEKVDHLATQLGGHSWSMESAFARLGQFAVAAINI